MVADGKFAPVSMIKAFCSSLNITEHLHPEIIRPLFKSSEKILLLHYSINYIYR